MLNVFNNFYGKCSEVCNFLKKAPDQLTFPESWDNTVGYLCRPFVNGNHVGYRLPFFSHPFSVLAKLFFQPEVTDKFPAKLSIGKHIKLGIDRFMAHIHHLIGWKLLFKGLTDLHRGPF